MPDQFITARVDSGSRINFHNTEAELFQIIVLWQLLGVG